MSLLVLTLRRIWRVLFFTNAFVWFILLFPFFYILLLNEKWFPKVFKLKKIWGSLILFPMGIRYTVESHFTPEPGKAYVFCPNHASYLDIMLIYLVIPVYFHTIGKAELLKVPLFGKFFSRMNIPIDRNSKFSGHRAILRASDDIKKGISIALFPEGGIIPHAPELGKFKNGPFKLALSNQVAIVPISFLNNWKLMPDDGKNTGGRPGLARVIVHEAIETHGMTEQDLERLKTETYQIIDKSLKEYAGK
jgi:1-acyl-sn-glycerol-3-phosphate acyltransferase